MRRELGTADVAVAVDIASRIPNPRTLAGLVGFGKEVVTEHVSVLQGDEETGENMPPLIAWSSDEASGIFRFLVSAGQLRTVEAFEYAIGVAAAQVLRPAGAVRAAAFGMAWATPIGSGQVDPTITRRREMVFCALLGWEHSDGPPCIAAEVVRSDLGTLVGAWSEASNQAAWVARAAEGLVVPEDDGAV